MTKTISDRIIQQMNTLFITYRKRHLQQVGKGENTTYQYNYFSLEWQHFF